MQEDGWTWASSKCYRRIAIESGPQHDAHDHYVWNASDLFLSLEKHKTVLIIILLNVCFYSEMSKFVKDILQMQDDLKAGDIPKFNTALNKFVTMPSPKLCVA